MSSISQADVQTSRLRQHVRTAGSAGPVVVLVHGNVSSGRFFEKLMTALSRNYRVITPDLRGYGQTELKTLDATRGVRDFSDDLHALFEAMSLTANGQKVHLVGWSVGGAVVQQYAIDHGAHVASLTLINPASPFGFGGTKDVQGTPCFEDFAGSGGGTANPDFAARLKNGDRTDEAPTSPRVIMNSFYFKPPFRSDEEEDFVDALLTTQVVEGNYPGDLTMSANWPTVAPGVVGMNNAISPKYLNLSGFATIAHKPPVLWIRGADDQIVSDTSLFDFGFLGQLGAVPGWPGAEIYPAQPMVGQTRNVLDQYKANGGSYREEVLPDCGHSPHIEKPLEFLRLLENFLGL